MKFLNGLELASYIKERQAHQVRALKQAKQIYPKLFIVSVGDDRPSQVYMNLKKNYGLDIGVEVEIVKTKLDNALTTVQKLNHEPKGSGIIVQLPLPDKSLTDQIVNAIEPQKDVDGLGENSLLDPATPIAIMWLLAGYNIDLLGKNIVIVGQGRLVGRPLSQMLQKSGLEPIVIDEFTDNKEDLISSADILISAAGSIGIISSELLKHKAVVVDAGVTSDSGSLKGDFQDAVYERDDLTITPKKGGVGPLTVAALFDNLIKSASD